jgi:hypothetical protein
VRYLPAEPRWRVGQALGPEALRGRRVGGGREQPKLSVRVLSTGNARENDRLDAFATALAAWRNERLPAIDPRSRGGAYYRKKKMAEGKSRKEALRCLKRRISDAVFKSLVADSQTPSRSAA